MRIKTKYGDVNIVETKDGAVEVRFDTMDNVLVQMNSTNSVTFHLLTPMTNVVKTKVNLKEYIKKEERIKGVE